LLRYEKLKVTFTWINCPGVAVIGVCIEAVVKLLAAFGERLSSDWDLSR